MSLKRALPWALLVTCAAGATLLLRKCGVPGAVLLGPMLAAVVFALAGAELRLKPTLLLATQSLMGCMVASVMSGDLLQVIADHWVAVLGANAFSIGAASVISVVLTRRRWFPGQTAIWGLSPGAATTMMMMGEERGEDPRLIAMMHNLRVVLVAVTAIAVASLVGANGVPAADASTVFSTRWPTALNLGTLLGLMSAGIGAALLLKRTQAAFWIPAVSGSALHVTQAASVEIPAAMAATAFAIGGCYAGLRFNRQAVAGCLRVMPAMLGAVTMLIGSCVLLIWPVQHAFGNINALTAFLAIMPGGIDVAVAVAHGMNASVPVIIAVQVTRFVVVTLLAPQVARAVARICEDRSLQ